MITHLTHLWLAVASKVELPRTTLSSESAHAAGDNSLCAQLPSCLELQTLTWQLQNVHSDLWLSTQSHTPPVSHGWVLAAITNNWLPVSKSCDGSHQVLYYWSSWCSEKGVAVVTGPCFWNNDVPSLCFSESWHTDDDSPVSMTMSHKQVLPTFSNTCHNQATVLCMLTWEQLPMSSAELTHKWTYTPCRWSVNVCISEQLYHRRKKEHVHYFGMNENRYE